MAYIGNKPTVGNFQICDAISVVNGQAAYTMQVGSVNVIPQSANHMIVSLNGTIQKPNSSFTVSGAVITFSSNLATGDVIDFIQILGDVLDLGVPSDATVTAAKLASTSITGQTAEATVANDDTVLIHDTSASALRKMTVSNLTANAGIDGWSSSSGNLLPADASKGIYLGVNSATAANLLDDYEEGTWTAGIDSGVFSFSKNTGYYRKVGNLVYVHLYLVTNGYTSGLRVNVTGLPFTSKNISSYDGHYPISCTRFSGVHESVLAVYPMVNPGGTTIKTDTTNSAGATCTSNNVEFFGAATHVRFGGCYLTD